MVYLFTHLVKKKMKKKKTCFINTLNYSIMDMIMAIINTLLVHEGVSFLKHKVPAG